MTFIPNVIGGGRVRRSFTLGGQRMPMGTILTAEQARSIPPRNLRALLDTNMLEVWPEAPATHLADDGPAMTWPSKHGRAHKAG